MWSVPSLRLWPSDAHLRAGDADRERAADELSRHCAAGRLTPEELSERLDTVLGARTLGELEAVRRDLPALAPAAGPKRRAPRRLLAAIVVVLSMLILAVLGAGVLEWAAQEPGAAVVVLLLLLVLGALVVAALGSLVLTLAPLIAVGIGMRWLARHLGELRAAAPAPRRDLRA
jgi:hypothetical protein